MVGNFVPYLHEFVLLIQGVFKMEQKTWGGN